MGLLDLATNPAVRFSRSGMPDAVEPLRPLNGATAAQASLRTHAVSDVTPASVKADPPKQTLRQDLLRSGYVPGSEGDRLFVAAHGGVNVWDDPGMSHDENERTFRATNIRQQRLRGSTPESFTGNLTEVEGKEQDRLADDLVTLATRDGISLEEATDSVDAVSEDLELSQREVLDALLADDDEVPSEEAILEAVNGPRSLEAIEKELHRDLITRVNEQLADARSGIRKAAKAPVGIERKSKGAPSTASGGPRPDCRFKPDGKKRKGSGGITTAPTAREHVPEGTASLRLIAEACQSIRQKGGAA